jgi:hypothetical protein
MKTINLTVDEATLAKVEQLATNQNTSVAALLNEYLRGLAFLPASRDEARRRLIRLSNSATGEVGPRTWTRDDLHER